MARTRKYSVLLLYPDGDNDGGDETYYDWVEATTVEEAVATARNNAIDLNEWGPGQGGRDSDEAQYEPDAFPVLLVITGHHLDLYEKPCPSPSQGDKNATL
jgi:hypothetical protein